MKRLLHVISLVLMLSGLVTGCQKSDVQPPDTGISPPVTPVNLLSIPKVAKVFGGGTGYYCYAPSAIQYDHKDYIFVCQNKVPFSVRDHIYLYTRIVNGDWGMPKEVLAPSEAGWDSIHVCDPDVRKVSVSYKGQSYEWLMVYLGTDQLDNHHNQLGIAFAHDIKGPYVKYDKNPIITSYASEWGVGQSTTLVEDSSKILLCYSKGTVAHTGMFAREIELKDLNAIAIGEEREISFDGLKNAIGGAATILHNASFAWSKGAIYIAAPVDPFESIPADIAPVASRIQLAHKSRSETLFGGSWELSGYIEKAQTGFPRNHNPGIQTDSYGNLSSDTAATVFFTGSLTDAQWLWSYQLYSAVFDSLGSLK